MNDAATPVTGPGGVLAILAAGGRLEGLDLRGGDAAGRGRTPCPCSLQGVGTGALAIFAAALRPLLRAAAPGGMGLAARTRAFAVLAALPALSSVTLDAGYTEFTTHAPSGQLAGNGWHESLHAFRVNEIDYTRSTTRSSTAPRRRRRWPACSGRRARPPDRRASSPPPGCRSSARSSGAAPSGA